MFIFSKLFPTSFQTLANSNPNNTSCCFASMLKKTQLNSAASAWELRYRIKVLLHWLGLHCDVLHLAGCVIPAGLTPGQDHPGVKEIQSLSVPEDGTALF